MTEKELLNLKKEIDNAKTRVSELTGKEKYLRKQLLEWECRNVEEAIKKLEEMNDALEGLTKEINERVIAIRTKYNV